MNTSTKKTRLGKYKLTTGKFQFFSPAIPSFRLSMEAKHPSVNWNDSHGTSYTMPYLEIDSNIREISNTLIRSVACRVWCRMNSTIGYDVFSGRECLDGSYELIFGECSLQFMLSNAFREFVTEFQACRADNSTSLITRVSFHRTYELPRLRSPDLTLTEAPSTCFARALVVKILPPEKITSRPSRLPLRQPLVAKRLTEKGKAKSLAVPPGSDNEWTPCVHGTMINTFVAEIFYPVETTDHVSLPDSLLELEDGAYVDLLRSFHLMAETVFTDWDSKINYQPRGYVIGDAVYHVFSATGYWNVINMETFAPLQKASENSMSNELTFRDEGNMLGSLTLNVIVTSTKHLSHSLSGKRANQFNHYETDDTRDAIKRAVEEALASREFPAKRHKSKGTLKKTD